jgi:exodeoxyribonuclease VII small subunit
MTKKSPSKNLQEKVSKMEFEPAMKRLDEIVEILSSEKIDLNLMIELYEEGVALKDLCSAKLAEAKMKIDVISKKENS